MAKNGCVKQPGCCAWAVVFRVHKTNLDSLVECNNVEIVGKSKTCPNILLILSTSLSTLGIKLFLQLIYVLADWAIIGHFFLNFFNRMDGGGMIFAP